MKKVILSAALLTLGLAASAQKGSILVAGNVGYKSNTTEVSNIDVKKNQFFIEPKIGYQFSDNMTVGVEGGYAHSKDENVVTVLNNEYTQDTKTNEYKIGGFLRYSVPFSQTFAAYADLGAGYKSIETEDTNYLGVTSDDKSASGDGFYVGLKPALFINFKNNFGLNFGIGGIEYANMDYDDDSSSSDFNFTLGKEISVGISKNFGGAK